MEEQYRKQHEEFQITLGNSLTEQKSHLLQQQEQFGHQQELFQGEMQEQHIKHQEILQVTLEKKLTDQEIRLLKQQERGQRRFQGQVSGQKTLTVQQQEEKLKCRKAQLPNMSLVLVYYALAKMAAINGGNGSDQTALLLQKLYGVDKGSLRQNLELIAGTSSKRKNLGERKLTEIRNQFELAINFFKEMNYPKGITVLKELEVKILGS